MFFWWFIHLVMWRWFLTTVFLYVTYILVISKTFILISWYLSLPKSIFSNGIPCMSFPAATSASSKCSTGIVNDVGDSSFWLASQRRCCSLGPPWGPGCSRWWTRSCPLARIRSCPPHPHRQAQSLDQSLLMKNDLTNHPQFTSIRADCSRHALGERGR